MSKDDFFQHEDDRRLLIEWVEDMPMRSAKALIAKSAQAVGDHYHDKKDEVFFLLTGTARRVVISGVEELDVHAPRKWYIPRGVHHVFELEKGSILLSAASERFDPSDELKLR